MYFSLIPSKKQLMNETSLIKKCGRISFRQILINSVKIKQNKNEISRGNF